MAWTLLGRRYAVSRDWGWAAMTRRRCLSVCTSPAQPTQDRQQPSNLAFQPAAKFEPVMNDLFSKLQSGYVMFGRWASSVWGSQVEHCHTCLILIDHCRVHTTTIICTPLLSCAHHYYYVHTTPANNNRVAAIAGASVEHNKFCVSVHFRNCRPDDVDHVYAAVERVLTGYPDLQMSRGRKVLEVKPTVDWDKGTALAHLLRALHLDDPHHVLAIYIGDDRTDEDAFRELAALDIGFGILVSSKVWATYPGLLNT